RFDCDDHARYIYATDQGKTWSDNCLVRIPTAASSKRWSHHFGAQIVFAFCGAVLFAANLAPTEEVVIIGIQTSWLKLIGVAVFSLLIAFLILHYSDFKGAGEFVRADHPTLILLGTV